MGRKQIFVGVFILLALVGVFFGVKKAKNAPKVTAPLPTSGVFEEIEKTFNLTIPSDVEKADLEKVGDADGLGVVTRKFQDGKFELMILASLPDPQVGKPYQGWLENEAGEKIFLGDLRPAKGGYLLEYTSDTDYFNYKKVIVSTDITILEGSF